MFIEGEKPYQCNICGQTFGGASNLYHHKMKHHPECEVEPPKRYSTSPSTGDTNRAQRGRPPTAKQKLSGGTENSPGPAMYAMTSYAQLAQAQEHQLKQYQSLWGSYYQK